MALRKKRSRVAPSQGTAVRRARKLRSLARRLEATYGPDTSPIAFDYGDGWTIRRVETLADQKREGQLMHHCLRDIDTPVPNAWSLRDAENLPHLTFCAYRVEPDDDLSEISLAPMHGRLQFVLAGRALFLVDLSRPLKPERRKQLVDFEEQGDISEFEPFPRDSVERILAVLPYFHPRLGVAEVNVLGVAGSH